MNKFRERLFKLFTLWKSGREPGFKGTQAVAIATGVYESDADIGYLKSFAIMTWLFGAELQGAALIISESEVLVLCAGQDLHALSSVISPAEGGLPQVTVLSNDDVDLDATVSRVVGNCLSIAVLSKELSVSEGPTINVVASLSKRNPVNAAPAIAVALAIKDVDELSLIKKASILSARVMKVTLTEKIEKTIDEDRKMSHTTLSDIAEEAIVNPSKVKLNFNPDHCDPCYPPIIQSTDSQTQSRMFDLRPSAECSEEDLAFGCIVASIGARYNFYCSNVSRTLLIGPSMMQREIYSIVLRAQESAINALVPDAPLKAAYFAAIDVFHEGQKSLSSQSFTTPDLLRSSLKNVGFGTGIEYRDSSFILNSKNEAKVREGMVFVVSVGLENIKDDANGLFSILISDTVLVRSVNLGPEVYTASSRKDYKHISYDIQMDTDDGRAASGVDGLKASFIKDSREFEKHRDEVLVKDGLRGRRRGNLDLSYLPDTEEEEQRRRKHQEALAKKMLDRGLLRLKGGNILTLDDAQQTKRVLLDEYRAYNSPKEFASLKPRCVIVDMDHEAIIVPINGIPIPFHISTLKNATKSDEGQYSYLRVNFHTPHTAVSRSLGRPDNSPRFPGFVVEKGSCTAFIKEFTFRSSNPINLNDCLRKIKELRKRAAEKATHQLEKDTLVEQQNLVIERGRSQLALSEVSIRPPMAKGKNNIGILEAHQNGFRYRSRNGSIDIIYNNIRNAFFQDANKELLVLIHFHLKNEIMIGSKRSKDVQFYVQVMEAVVKLNESRRRQFDQDELEEEQQERDLRNRTNKSFFKFTKEVEERYGIEFDVPYRQLEFMGAPRSVAVTLLPTVSCIVNLTEWPPFVLNLADVEVAHFERVIFSLRNFDMVFVLKGFEDDPAATGRAAREYWLRINSIPMEELTPLKRYLDEQNIKYYEGKISLQWNEVLKNVRQDLEAFYNEGGWKFLSIDESEDGDGSDGKEDSMEGDIEFDPGSDDALESGSESSESDSYASDAARELLGDSDEGEDELSSGEEGATWEELEGEAYQDDLRHGRCSDDEDDGRKRKGGRVSGQSRNRSKSSRVTSLSQKRKPI